MKVKQLIKELQKYPENAIVSTFAGEKFDFTYTPIAEILLKENLELHPEFRGRGKKVFNDYVVLAGLHQKWKGV